MAHAAADSPTWSPDARLYAETLRTRYQLEPPRSHWPLGPYGLTLVLAACFLVSLAFHAAADYASYAADQQAHSGIVTTGAWLTHFADEVFENWQSEFLQLVAQVVLPTYLVHRWAVQSADTSQVTTTLLLHTAGEVVALRRAVAALRQPPADTGDDVTTYEPTTP